MRIIGSKLHGLYDYLNCAILIASPWLFDFANNRIEMWIILGLGVFNFLLSLMTNYEFGLFKFIKMKVHVETDIATGLLLIISPWALNFDERIFLIHVVLGFIQLLVAFNSQMDSKADLKRRRMWKGGNLYQ